MKRTNTIFIVLIMLFASLSFLLYNNILRFNYENVDEIILQRDTDKVILNKDLNSIITLVARLESLKQYRQVSEVSNQKDYQINLDMKYGKDKVFTIHLDHDFSKLYITDIQKNIIYLLDDDTVELIYLIDSFDTIYDYKNPKYHEIYFNDEEIITSSKSSWHFMKGDRTWNESIIDNDAEIIKLDFTDTGDEFSYSSTQEPRSINLVVKKDDKVLFNSTLDNGFYIPNMSGLYSYKLTSEWSGDFYSGSYKSDFLVECIYPPEFSVSKEKIELGEFTTIIARNIHDPELLYVNQNITNKVEFIRNGDYYECIIPATYYTELGSHTIEYGIDGYSELTQEIEVVDREFSIQYLTVDKKTESSTRTTEAYDQYHKYYRPALLINKYEDEKNYSEIDKFVLPVGGRLSTEFGERRYVNGTPISYNHAGYDIATERGTEVVSTYKGRVVLAMELILTGNSVVVSHGNGIFSTYFHLDELSVTEGELVETGQKIGEVGTTGFSTGPHLHFSISYYNVNLEPGYFLYNKKVTFENYRELFNNN